MSFTGTGALEEMQGGNGGEPEFSVGHIGCESPRRHPQDIKVLCLEFSRGGDAHLAASATGAKESCGGSATVRKSRGPERILCTTSPARLLLAKS